MEGPATRKGFPERNVIQWVTLIKRGRRDPHFTDQEALFQRSDMTFLWAREGWRPGGPGSDLGTNRCSPIRGTGPQRRRICRGGALLRRHHEPRYPVAHWFSPVALPRARATRPIAGSELLSDGRQLRCSKRSGRLSQGDDLLLHQAATRAALGHSRVLDDPW